MHIDLRKTSDTAGKTTRCQSLHEDPFRFVEVALVMTFTFLVAVVGFTLIQLAAAGPSDVPDQLLHAQWFCSQFESAQQSMCISVKGG